MGSVEPYETSRGRRYRVRYRDPDRNSREKAGFSTKRDAEQYLAEQTVSMNRGQWIDPAAGRTTVAELAPGWLKSKAHLKPSAYRPLETAWRVHVEPQWGQREIARIRPSAVQDWVSDLGVGSASARSATTVLRAHSVLAGILDVALRDRLLTSNPARGVSLPRKRRKARPYLRADQVELLASNAGQYSALVLFLAYSGARWGEATALRVGNLDLLRRPPRIRIEENAVRVGTEIIVGTPKSHEARAIAVPTFLAELLAAECEGKTRDQLVFGDGHTHLRPQYGRRPWFQAAVEASQEVDADFPRLTPHDLRHTAASLAISAGANVKAVQRMLGHASAAMTLDVYADLFDEDLDGVATALEQRRADAIVGDLWGIRGQKGPQAL